jgi:hypothetical protein
MRCAVVKSPPECSCPQRTSCTCLRYRARPRILYRRCIRNRSRRSPQRTSPPHKATRRCVHYTRTLPDKGRMFLGASRNLPPSGCRRHTRSKTRHRNPSSGCPRHSCYTPPPPQRPTCQRGRRNGCATRHTNDHSGMRCKRSGSRGRHRLCKRMTHKWHTPPLQLRCTSYHHCREERREKGEERRKNK